VSTLQVGSHLLAVPEVVGYDSVDIGQLQGIIGADHFFDCHAFVVLLDY
jgi:hypothetical protein